jgi:hypothetical protein
MPGGFYQAAFYVKNQRLMEFYTYQHRSADTNQIFYVGKGKGNRLFDKNKRGRHWKFYVNKHGFVVEKLIDKVDEELAFFVEVEAIDLYKKRGIKLVNLTNGGEGCTGFSMKHTEEQKRKWSLMRKGTPSPRKGVILTSETKQKIRQSRVGKPLSEEHKKTISQSLLGNKNTAKLTEDQVRFVRANQGKMTHIELGEMFNIHKNTIHKIWRFERYKDVI